MVEKKFGNFLFAGCSHTVGSEIFYPKSLGDLSTEKEAAFGAVLSKSLNKKYYNIAQPGVGNQFIARSVLFWLLRNKKKIHNTFVIIHWTGEHRLDFSYERREDEQMTVGAGLDDCFDVDQVCIMPGSFNANFPLRHKNTIKYLQKAVTLETNDRVWQQIDKFTAVLWMQELLKYMNIQYLFFNSYDSLQEVERYRLYVENIDTTKFIQPYKQGGGFYERVCNAGFVSTARFLHHQEPGHRWYAKWLLENYFCSLK